MKKNIRTLIDDIYALFDPTRDVVPTKEQLETFSKNLTNKVCQKLSLNEKKPGLRFSNLGKPCSRQLWYSVNKPELAEKVRGSVSLKFLFGDLIEELLVFLARLSGHDVVDMQKEVSIGGIPGHIDCSVDDVLVDVKSASSPSFKRFEQGLKRDDDAFGYLTQLGLYNEANGTGEEPAAFLAMDKQLGDLTLDIHYDLKDVDYEKLVAERKKMIKSKTPPERAFKDVPEGKSGNMKLDTVCSYCPHKMTCWPGLRTFIYSRGPMYLTTVKREPDVFEIKPGKSQVKIREEAEAVPA